MVTVVAVTPGADAVLPPPVLELPQAAVSNAAAPPAAAAAQVLDLLISRMRVLLVCAGTGCWCHREATSGAAGRRSVRRLERSIRLTPRMIDATPPATPRGNARIATMRTIP